MAQDDIAARMLEALDGASSLQLAQLRALIDGMLAELKRTMQACADLPWKIPYVSIEAAETAPATRARATAQPDGLRRGRPRDLR